MSLVFAGILFGFAIVAPFEAALILTALNARLQEKIHVALVERYAEIDKALVERYVDVDKALAERNEAVDEALGLRNATLDKKLAEIKGLLDRVAPPGG